jgi:hypothetical protein
MFVSTDGAPDNNSTRISSTPPSSSTVVAILPVEIRMKGCLKMFWWVLLVISMGAMPALVVLAIVHPPSGRDIGDAVYCFFGLPLLAFVAFLEVRYYVRVDEQGITHQVSPSSICSAKFVSWDAIQLIVIGVPNQWLVGNYTMIEVFIRGQDDILKLGGPNSLVKPLAEALFATKPELCRSLSQYRTPSRTMPAIV